MGVLVLNACSFPAPPNDLAEDECSFTFHPLCDIGFRGQKTFSSISIDTTTSVCTEIVQEITFSGSVELCVISAEEIVIPSGVTVTALGTRPLVLASKENIRISGTLDVSSRRSPNSSIYLEGAGAQLASCSPFPNVPGSSTSGAGGGAGGSFNGLGGKGGFGSFALPGQANSGTPNPTASAEEFELLRGGCGGQAGGDADALRIGGLGGASGGAVYLAAKKSIQLLGGSAVIANGAGGLGGAKGAGGGGGGSGGTVVLEAPEVFHLGIIATNGGGGGEGGDEYYAGANGADGKAGIIPASGGNSPSPVGDGGDGAAKNKDAARPGAPAATGGGGGGGGIGRIRIVSKMISGTGGVSSPPYE